MEPAASGLTLVRICVPLRGLGFVLCGFINTFGITAENAEDFAEHRRGNRKGH